jgi:Holliday junction resolvase RusA-like endonuclease
MSNDLVIRLDVDPVGLTQNFRFKGTYAVPAHIRKIMDKIRQETRSAIADQEWEMGPTDDIEIQFDEYFRTRRGDWDNPVKRTQDAVCDGIGINDNRVRRAIVNRYCSDEDEPYMVITVRILPEDETPCARRVKKPKDAPIWVG